MRCRNCARPGDATISFVGRNTADKQEIKMATNRLDTNKPVLYWLTLAIMITAFVAVVLS
jgi:hypothetical protein